MGHPQVYVDGILVHWGDRLFYEPVRGRRAPRAARVQWAGRAARASAMRAQIDRTLRKVPEVMVKITNRPGTRNGMAAIRSHLEYVSRNGEVELEDQDGESIAGWHDVQDLARMWRHAGRGIAEESERREAFNVMLSMPPGTDRAAVKAAAREFAREEFGGKHDYVFAAHNDENHPHVHLVVLARGRDGRRLNPRKADLQRWRERFAHELREHGVEANATPRRTRGVTQRYERQSIRQMRERGVTPRARPAAPDARATFEAHLPTMTAWRATAEVLASSSDVSDQRMAREITDFVREMPVAVGARGIDKRDVVPQAGKKPSGHRRRGVPDAER
ncbi:relaxase/mobilization nuclease domain-containing protein [Burkholderia pyrrocinia]|uniref:relaxase/mobilization nuclease domain-containing protein n=1 Tax=Burkholderia pyrrocinia TaxID=60550 RepID=UPI001BCF0602|nr:relaxase/mobilization nuclease domain-containing protein [Burkholderia pyrrocinia]QVN18993.1 relaxase/mobilization nuclease domain-containing protein [Burkholderia pyrrocinia]